jgi:hypothetical protein
MVELALLMYVMVGFFGFLGVQRGWTKELISMAGIILALFGLYQFDTLIRQTLLGGLPPDQRFYIQTAMFLGVVFFAYQTRALVGGDANRARGQEGRDPLQTKVLGAIAGGVNGYLVFGTIWYLLDVNRLGTGQYPLDPFIVAPIAGTPSAGAVANLPLYLLTNNGANGDLLSLLVIILFIWVLVMI